MSKDELIKKKVGELLTKWHVSDEEKTAFLQDLEEEIAKPDEEEDLESVAEETTEVEEEPAENEVGEEEVEEQEVSEVAEEPTETEPTEPVEEPLPEEPVEEQPESEVPSEEPLPEQPPMEETPVDQPVEEQPQQSNEDMLKTIEGLTSRIASLEDIVSKLGTPVQEEIGVEPQNPSGESYVESELDRYNRLRRGR